MQRIRVEILSPVVMEVKKPIKTWNVYLKMSGIEINVKKAENKIMKTFK